MKIAIVASIWINVPPIGYGFGAQEYLAYYIAEGMKKKGHDVTLFASGNSNVDTKLISVSEKQVADIEFPDPKIKDIFELMNLSEAYKISSQFDIIHNHLLPYGLLFANLTSIPTVHTLHHAINEKKADIFLYKRYKNQNFISISNTQRKILPDLNYISTVYNGIDTNFYSFKEKIDGNYILYIGRLKRYKGIHTAIELSKTTGIKLIIAAPLPKKSQSDYKETMDYWEKEIKPHIGNTIEYIEGIHTGPKKVELIQNAKILMFPVEREEPFGMTVIEAMACGTPVIAYDMGAMPEIIVDGKTGFLVNYTHENKRGEWIIKEPGITGLKQAIEKIFNMKDEDYHRMRTESHSHVKSTFTVEQMVSNYEKVYNKIIESKNL